MTTLNQNAMFASSIFGNAGSVEELHALVKNYRKSPEEHAEHCKSLLVSGESLKLGDIIVDATLKIKSLLYINEAESQNEETLEKCAILSKMRSIDIMRELAKEIEEIDETLRSKLIKAFNEQFKPTVEADTIASNLFKRISEKV